MTTCPLLFRIVVAAACVVPLVLQAQILSPLPGTFSIEVDPPYPGPNEAVILRATGNSLELAGSAMSWTVNGKVAASDIGTRSLSIRLGASGSSVSVEATTIARDGERSYSSLILRPTEVDLLWSANSYVPPFFRGRSLPSAGTTMRFEALARFERANGSSIQPNDLVYTWQRDNRVLAEISGRGKNIVEIPAPPLFGSSVISVTVTSLDNTYSGGVSERIFSEEPMLLLYQDHPLFGTLTNEAIRESARFGDSEATFAVIPYYADILNAPADYIFGWSVNSSPVPESDSPDRIAIRTEGVQSIAQIEVVFSHALNWLQNARKTWNITFEPETLDGF